MLSRRAVLGAGVSAGLVATRPTRAQDLFGGMRGALDAAGEGLSPGAPVDQSELFARALDKAELNAQPLFLPPGRYEIGGIRLPRYTHLLGVPGQTRLVCGGGVYRLRADGAATLRMEGLVLDGLGLPLDPYVRALLQVDGVDEVALDDCEVLGSEAGAIVLRDCAGRAERLRLHGARTVGLYVEQSRGMEVTGNSVFDCGDTGILVQRDEEGSDDTVVSGNRVSRIRADSGGTGQYGNGINVSKANGVIVAGNRVDDCGFSAIRFFSSDNVQATDNILTRSGEMALYVEFASEGAIVPATSSTAAMAASLSPISWNMAGGSPSAPAISSATSVAVRATRTACRRSAPAYRPKRMSPSPATWSRTRSMA